MEYMKNNNWNEFSADEMQLSICIIDGIRSSSEVKLFLNLKSISNFFSLVDNWCKFRSRFSMFLILVFFTGLLNSNMISFNF